MTEITDCVDASDSAWWTGPHGLALANTQPLRPYPYRGAQGWPYADPDLLDPQLVAEVREWGERRGYSIASDLSWERVA